MLWFDRAGMDSADYRDLAAASMERRPRVIAWAALERGLVACLSDRLAVRDGGEWRFVPWDDVLTGGWDPTTGRLAWETAAGPDHVEPTSPGRVPEAFRERVTASIVITHHAELSRGRTLAIAARRNPADARAALRWEPLPSRNVDPSSPADAAEVAAAIAEAKAEWDIA